MILGFRFIKTQTYNPQIKNMMTRLHTAMNNPNKSRNGTFKSYSDLMLTHFSNLVKLSSIG